MYTDFWKVFILPENDKLFKSRPYCLIECVNATCVLTVNLKKRINISVAGYAW